MKWVRAIGTDRDDEAKMTVSFDSDVPLKLVCTRESWEMLRCQAGWCGNGLAGWRTWRCDAIVAECRETPLMLLSGCPLCKVATACPSDAVTVLWG